MVLMRAMAEIAKKGLAFCSKESVCTEVGAAEAARGRPLAPAIAPIRGLRQLGAWIGWAPFKDAKGPSMSIKLTDTQLVVLSAAAQREDRCLILPPTLKGGAAQKVANKLISSGFTKEVRPKAGAPIWRRDEESGEDYALKLTAAGAKAIAVAENPEREHGNDDGGLLESADEPTAPLRVLKAPLAEAIEPAPVGPSAPRTGSKLARVIELLRRDHGATIDELIAATGWLAHDPRRADRPAQARLSGCDRSVGQRARIVLSHPDGSERRRQCDRRRRRRRAGELRGRAEEVIPLSEAAGASSGVMANRRQSHGTVLHGWGAQTR